jgi:CheY-like chemotaxis protein
MARSRVVSGYSFENLSVMIVEDNKHMRALLCAMLQVAGIRSIMEAASGDAALQLLRSSPCDIVFSDMSMKPMDGLAFTRALRNDSHSPNHFVPVIMITGHTERHRVEQARDAGVTEFLAKPVTAQSLFSRIAEIVERPRPFIRCDDFFGPDRRRRLGEDYAGPLRRDEDADDIAVI